MTPRVLKVLCIFQLDSVFHMGQDWVKDKYRIVLATVLRTEEPKGFSVLPRRWVVERTLAWLGQSRRLSKDYEELPTTSEPFIYGAMTRLMLRRLAA